MLGTYDVLLYDLSITTTLKTTTVENISKYRYLVVRLGVYCQMIPVEIFKLMGNYYISTANLYDASDNYTGIALCLTYNSDTSLSYKYNIGTTANKFYLYGWY